MYHMQWDICIGRREGERWGVCGCGGGGGGGLKEVEAKVNVKVKVKVKVKGAELNTNYLSVLFFTCRDIF